MKRKSCLGTIAAVIYGGYVLVATIPSLWMLVGAPTWVGKVIGLTGLALAGLPLSAYLGFGLKSLRWRGTVWGQLALIGSSIVGILLATPSGKAPDSSPVQHRFTKATHFPRYVPSNIIPEAEQIHLGFLLASVTDRHFTPEQSRRVSPFTFDLYREMRRDRNFRALGSVMGWAYMEVLGQPFDVGHYYLYVPQNVGNEPLPTIVFLHGSAGNFKTYTWVWSRFAEEHGFVIVAPSFGFGNWMKLGGLQAVTRALDDALTIAPIDENQVYLAGLSNGGLGVSRAANAAPERYQGLIFLSPVMAMEITDGALFQEKWQERPIIVISGEDDKRIPISYVQKRVKRLRAGDVDVTLRIYPEEDHFLFFSQPDGVLDDIAKWMAD